jgi:hypothetical protein
MRVLLIIAISLFTMNLQGQSTDEIYVYLNNNTLEFTTISFNLHEDSNASDIILKSDELEIGEYNLYVEGRRKPITSFIVKDSNVNLTIKNTFFVYDENYDNNEGYVFKIKKRK